MLWYIWGYCISLNIKIKPLGKLQLYRGSKRASSTFRVCHNQSLFFHICVMSWHVQKSRINKYVRRYVTLATHGHICAFLRCVRMYFQFFFLTMGEKNYCVWRSFSFSTSFFIDFIHYLDLVRFWQREKINVIPPQQPEQTGLLAQLAERATVNRKASGSIPL